MCVYVCVYNLARISYSEMQRWEWMWLPCFGQYFIGAAAEVAVHKYVHESKQLEKFREWDFLAISPNEIQIIFTHFAVFSYLWFRRSYPIMILFIELQEKNPRIHFV